MEISMHIRREFIWCAQTSSMVTLLKTLKTAAIAVVGVAFNERMGWVKFLEV